MLANRLTIVQKNIEQSQFMQSLMQEGSLQGLHIDKS